MHTAVLTSLRLLLGVGDPPHYAYVHKNTTVHGQAVLILLPKFCQLLEGTVDHATSLEFLADSVPLKGLAYYQTHK